jgi:hypothetical protein
MAEASQKLCEALLAPTCPRIARRCRAYLGQRAGEAESAVQAMDDGEMGGPAPAVGGERGFDSHCDSLRAHELRIGASQIGLGMAHEAAGDLQDAVTAYSQAVEVAERSRASTPAAERVRFFEGKAICFRRLEAYEGLVPVLHRLGREEDAFYWGEHTRARVLLEVAAAAQVVVVPDKAIQFLPLEALVVSKPEPVIWKDGPYGPYPEGVRYVGDSCTFTYWQSGTAMTMARRLRREVGGDRALVIADPLFAADDPRAQDLAQVRLAATNPQACGQMSRSTASLRRASRPPGGNESLFDSGDLSRRVSELPPCPS